MNTRGTAEELRQFLHARLNSEENEAFCLSLIFGVRRNQEEIDAALGKVAANWSVSRMASTDRNVLRLGAYEVMYSDTPYKVAINEAIELAKRYGNANSAHFVNGILDKLPRKESKSG